MKNHWIEGVKPLLQKKLDTTWYNERMRDRIESEIERRTEMDLLPDDVHEVLNELPLSPYEDPEALRTFTEEAADAARAERQRREEAGRQSRKGYSPADYTRMMRDPVAEQTRNLQATEMRKRRQEEREAIDALVVEVRRHLSDLDRILRTARASPFKSGVTKNATLLLDALFLVGVVYPLSFMPLSTGEGVTVDQLSVGAFFETLLSFKGLLLAAVTVAVLGLSIAFIAINSSLTVPEYEIERLESRAQLPWYSEHFAWIERQAS